jgi:hypothetical protein
VIDRQDFESSPDDKKVPSAWQDRAEFVAKHWTESSEARTDGLFGVLWLRQVGGLIREELVVEQDLPRCVWEELWMGAR